MRKFHVCACVVQQTFHRATSSTSTEEGHEAQLTAHTAAPQLRSQTVLALPFRREMAVDPRCPQYTVVEEHCHGRDTGIFSELLTWLPPSFLEQPDQHLFALVLTIIHYYSNRKNDRLTDALIVAHLRSSPGKEILSRNVQLLQRDASRH